MAARYIRMATTQIPTTESTETRRDFPELHVVPVLLVDVADERARGRMHEAGLLSIVVHLGLFIAILLSPKWVPQKQVKVWTAQELIDRNRELTYLEMPKDNQQVTKRPDTNIISDKDRIATRRPTIDRKALQELRDSTLAKPGPPAPPSPPRQAQAPPPSPPPKPAAESANQMAKLQPPPAMEKSKSAFGKMPLSPGSAIQQAARAAAANRAGGGGIGVGGDYGLDQGRRPGEAADALEILSDTMGVDFGPYLARVLHDVRTNWYNLIPEVARAPMMKRGRVAIEFAIKKDGSVAGLRLTDSSGDVSLDRAALGGITGSNPFPPLPNEFGGQYLALRFHFYYNPERADLR